MTGFGRLLRAEWIKFRTVRGWVIAMMVAALLIVLIGMWAGSAGQDLCGSGGAARPPASPTCRGGRVAKPSPTTSTSSASRFPATAA